MSANKELLERMKGTTLVVSDPSEIKGRGDDDEFLVVCVSSSARTAFRDNVLANCVDCGTELQHRPHVPKHFKPICHDCALKRWQNDTTEKQLFITPATAAEIKTEGGKQ